MGLCDVLHPPVKHLAFPFLRGLEPSSVAAKPCVNREAYDCSSISRFGKQVRCSMCLGPVCGEGRRRGRLRLVGAQDLWQRGAQPVRVGTQYGLLDSGDLPRVH
jgi:hypothetical protein